MSVVRVPNPWKYLLSLSIFSLLAGGCSYTGGSTPTISVSNQAQIESALTPEPGTAPLLSNSPAPANTLVPPMPTLTISSSATVELATETTVTEEKKTWLQVSPADLYANPEDFFGKRFMIDGVVIGLGMRKFEGKDVYVIQVGVLDYPRPIIVLDFLPNPTLGMHDGIIIGGTGGGAYYGIDPTNPKSFTPVILGEWYECNLPWDQWKYPYEFWNPIQLEGLTVN